jgi:uncharacterized membrane protein YjgN (DUF898 family)
MRRSSALFIASGLALFVATLPVIFALVAGIVAKSAGCSLNAAGNQSCIVFGMEAGNMLYSMSIAIWLLIFTWLYLPLAIGFAVAEANALRLGRQNPFSNRPVGAVFWLLLSAVLMFIFSQRIAAALTLFAAFLWWHQKKRAGMR